LNAMNGIDGLNAQIDSFREAIGVKAKVIAPTAPATIPPAPATDASVSPVAEAS
jgi:hypothetical protein